MNLTFREIEDSRNTLVKIINSAAITDFDDAVAIGGLKTEVDIMLEASMKGLTAVKKPFIEKGSARANSLHPNGRNTELEVLEMKEAVEKEQEKIYSKAMKFPILKETTIKKMFEDEDKKYKLSPYDLNILKKLGMIKKEGK